MKQCFQVHPADNVATLLEDAENEPLLVHGGEVPGTSIVATEAIALGHKIALRTIPADAPVIKYGVIIGIATVPIQAGQWVHLHNCRSRLDERSSHLDLHTGAAKDTVYE